MSAPPAVRAAGYGLSAITARIRVDSHGWRGRSLANRPSAGELPDFAGVHGDWTNPAAFSRIRLRERFQEPQDSSVSIGKSVSMALDSHKLPRRIWENKRKPENPLVLPGEHRHAGSSAANSRHDRLLVRLQPAAHAIAYRARRTPRTATPIPGCPTAVHAHIGRITPVRECPGYHG